MLLLQLFTFERNVSKCEWERRERKLLVLIIHPSSIPNQPPDQPTEAEANASISIHFYENEEQTSVDRSSVVLGLQSETLGNIKPINVWVCKRHAVATYNNMRDSDKVRQLLIKTLNLRYYKVRCVKTFDPMMLSPRTGRTSSQQVIPPFNQFSLPPPPQLVVSPPSLAEAPVEAVVEVPPSVVQCTFYLNLICSFHSFFSKSRPYRTTLSAAP